MSYRISQKTTTSFRQTLVEELVSLAKAGETRVVVFHGRDKYLQVTLNQYRESFVGIKQVFLLPAFTSLTNVSVPNIIIENEYNYDPNNLSFKFGQWFRDQVKNKLLTDITYDIRFIGNANREDWQLHSVQTTAPDS